MLWAVLGLKDLQGILEVFSTGLSVRRGKDQAWEDLQETTTGMGTAGGRSRGTGLWLGLAWQAP